MNYKLGYKMNLREDIPELDINIMQDSFSDKKWIETIKKLPIVDLKTSVSTGSFFVIIF